MGTPNTVTRAHQEITGLGTFSDHQSERILKVLLELFDGAYDSGYDTGQERERERDGVPARQVALAWMVQGPHPPTHHAAQARLRREWPSMYAAVQACLAASLQAADHG